MDLLSPIDLTTLPAVAPTTGEVVSEVVADMSETDHTETTVVCRNANDGQSTPPSTAQERLQVVSPVDKNEEHARTEAAEERRARRSAIERKSRLRRLNILQRMRDEVKQLEGILKKCSELSLVVHALEQDRDNLQRSIWTHETFQLAVRELSEPRQIPGIWNSGVPSSVSLNAPLRQRSVAECYEIVRESYAEIQRFSECEDYETTGASFLGWTDKRKYDSQSQALNYSFTKHFPQGNPEELLLKTWNMFASGPNLEYMTSNGRIKTRYEVLQVVNDDMLIFRRDYRPPGIPVTLVSIQIIFRVQTASGYTMCMRSIPAPEIEAAFEPHECIFETFHWTHLNWLYDKYDNRAGCESIAAGSVRDHKQLNSMYWLFDCACAVIRWETACVAPLFLKEI